MSLEDARNMALLFFIDHLVQKNGRRWEKKEKRMKNMKSRIRLWNTLIIQRTTNHFCKDEEINDQLMKMNEEWNDNCYWMIMNG